MLFSQGEISLVNLSKCFLANRDNFCPYEQGLRMFVPGKENNIYDHSSKEHFKISKIAKFGWQMLSSRENLAF